jgi:hypothetical protein
MLYDQINKCVVDTLKYNTWSIKEDTVRCKQYKMYVGVFYCIVNNTIKYVRSSK